MLLEREGTISYVGRMHQYFPKSLKRLNICIDGRFFSRNSTVSLLLPLLASTPLYCL